MKASNKIAINEKVSLLSNNDLTGSSTNSSEFRGNRRAIVEGVLGFSLDVNGRGRCPFEHNHSKKSTLDFQVCNLDEPVGGSGVWARCFHTSCSDVVEELSLKLNRAVWEEETGGKRRSLVVDGYNERVAREPEGVRRAGYPVVDMEAVPSELPRGGRDGVWFLVQPVHGDWRPNKNRILPSGQVAMSRRSENSISEFRYLVLERDGVDEGLWLAAVAQLRLPVVAMYTSGGRSVHVLVRVDAKSKADFDTIREGFLAALCPLGADGAAMTGVRLSRLPGMLRGKQMQELLFFNPAAEVDQVIGRLPVRKDFLTTKTKT